MLCSYSALRFIDLCHFFLCVPVWLTDSSIEQTRRKTIWKTVIFIGKCNISKIRRYYSFVYCCIRDKCVKYAAHNNSQQRCYVVYLSCILSAASPHRDQPNHKRSCSDSDHNDFKAITIVIDQRDSVSCDLKICALNGVTLFSRIYPLAIPRIIHNALIMIRTNILRLNRYTIEKVTKIINALYKIPTVFLSYSSRQRRANVWKLLLL